MGREQSDLGPYCLQYRLPKSRREEQRTKVMTGAPRANSILKNVLQGRARAREAEYIILIEEENFDEFESQLKMYRNIEQVSLGIIMAI